MRSASPSRPTSCCRASISSSQPQKHRRWPLWSCRDPRTVRASAVSSSRNSTARDRSATPVILGVWPCARIGRPPRSFGQSHLFGAPPYPPSTPCGERGGAGGGGGGGNGPAGGGGGVRGAGGRPARHSPRSSRQRRWWGGAPRLVLVGGESGRARTCPAGGRRRPLGRRRLRSLVGVPDTAATGPGGGAGVGGAHR